MADIRTPAFRKAMKGYNKEDVNNYVISLNRALEDNKRLYERNLNECNARAEADYKRICELSGEISEKDKIIAALRTELEALRPLKEELEAKDFELEETKAILEETKAALDAVENNSDRSKAEYYNSVCAKAGEILFIASGTAENILNHANDEAQRIVGDANSKKDLMLKTFSDSACAAADDINVYIKSAVEECIKKIDQSVKEAAEMANAEKKKPRTVFINEK